MKELLEYNPESGKLYWKRRDLSWFEDGPRFSAQAICNVWNANRAEKEAFTKLNAQGYFVGVLSRNHFLGKEFRANRIIWLWNYGYLPPVVEHINGIRSDNRLHNLRDATQLINMQNVARSIKNKSGTTGIFWREDKQRWVAYINQNGVRYYLGHFLNEQDAINARKHAATEMGFGPNHGK